MPSVAAKTVDTTGAGDIFFGTFVSEFVKSGKRLDELTFENAVDFTKKAVLISGKSTEKHGAIASIPDMI
ncbi:MAG: PfkB family carbohydrate kinase [Acutalibacteraceae bacterium]